MSNEIFDLDLCLLGSTGTNGLLTGDSTLMGLVSGIYPDVAPQGTATPFVIYSLQSSDDTNAIGAKRVISDDMVVIRATDQSENYASLKPIANRIETLLQSTFFTGSGSVLSFRRKGAIRFPETLAGKSYRHSGGTWEMIAQTIF